MTYFSGFDYDNLQLTVSPFLSWLAGQPTNSESLLKYAVGGATSALALPENLSSSVETNRLTLTAVVRTNDPKLTLAGESSATLTNWSSLGVTSAPAANQANVPSGHERRIYSAPFTNNQGRLFLRVKATYTP